MKIIKKPATCQHLNLMPSFKGIGSCPDCKAHGIPLPEPPVVKTSVSSWIEDARKAKAEQAAEDARIFGVLRENVQDFENEYHKVYGR
jgi:hypothetical protein